jgi:hypothetical protein
MVDLSKAYERTLAERDALQTRVEDFEAEIARLEQSIEDGRHIHGEYIDELEQKLRGVPRAQGLAQALASCRDDAPLSGVREIAAEIVTLLQGRQG